MSLLPISKIIRSKTLLNSHNWCLAGVRDLPNSSRANIHDVWQSISILPEYKGNDVFDIANSHFDDKQYDLHYEFNHATDKKSIFFEIHFQTRDQYYKNLWNSFIQSLISGFRGIYQVRNHIHPPHNNFTIAIQHSCAINYEKYLHSTVEQEKMVKIINEMYVDLHSSIVDFYLKHLIFIRKNSLNYNKWKITNC
jgi:hypothetical protein